MTPNKPRDRPGGKVYKCHNETPFEAANCIRYEDVTILTTSQEENVELY